MEGILSIILKPLPTFWKLLILLLSERTDLLSALIHFGHWKKLIIELTQQAFQRCNKLEHVWLQPCLNSIVKREREKSKVDRLLKEVLELECGTNILELLHMAVRIFKI
jgi:hypothetical protein